MSSDPLNNIEINENSSVSPDNIRTAKFDLVSQIISGSLLNTQTSFPPPAREQKLPFKTNSMVSDETFNKMWKKLLQTTNKSEPH